jgi:hypothetical protein
VAELDQKPAAECQNITGELDDIASQIALNINKDYFSIQAKTIIQAIDLVEYFNKHMLLASNYNINGLTVEQFINITIND